jgi:hypothetical protein
VAKAKRGPTALDLLALGGIAALVIVLILPRLSGLKIDHNERDAVHALSILHRRLTDLRNDRRGVDPAQPTPLDRLVASSADGRAPLDDCQIRRDASGAAILERHGYVFRLDYESAPRDGALPFQICAIPVAYGETGSLAYAVTQERELLRSRNLSRRYDAENPPAARAFLPLSRSNETASTKGAYDAQDGTQWERIEWPSQP